MTYPMAPRIERICGFLWDGVASFVGLHCGNKSWIFEFGKLANEFAGFDIIPQNLDVVLLVLVFEGEP